ncbi:HNH endonuclease [bacterium]|nr:HNH endonuclease [bacterium]
MPRRPLKPCTRTGCSYTVRKQGNCHPDCKQVRREPEERQSASARGYGSRWQKLRLMVLKREPLCRHCNIQGQITLATDVDHIISLVRGGTNELNNLQPLCHSCHSKKTAREDGAFGRGGAGQFSTAFRT